MNTAKYSYQALFYISQNGSASGSVMNQALAVMARCATDGSEPTTVETNELYKTIGGPVEIVTSTKPVLVKQPVDEDQSPNGVTKKVVEAPTNK
jgi:hypothetical protein